MKHKKDDNRRNTRYIVDNLAGNVFYTSELEVLNLSIDGAAIETARRLELNREYTFKLKCNNSLLSLRGIVVWAILVSKVDKHTGAISPVYRAGIRFTDTLNEKASMLIKFIEENKTRNLENRLGGVRFKISAKEQMKVDLIHEYRVRKISLSGMLVETEYPLGVESCHDIELFINSHSLAILGRVANIKDVITDGVLKYEIGIEFSEMSEENKQLLLEFLKSLEDV
jgi:hypothetical protein